MSSFILSFVFLNKISFKSFQGVEDRPNKLTQNKAIEKIYLGQLLFMIQFIKNTFQFHLSNHNGNIVPQ